MKKISLVLVLVTIVAGPAWAGGPHKNQGSTPKPQTLQKLQGLKIGGHGSQSSHSGQNHKPIKSQPITAQNLVQNQKPLKSQGITAQNLVPNRPLKPLKGSESVHNTLPVLVSKPVPVRPGHVWTGDHWQRAQSTAGPAGTGNLLPVDSSSNFLNLANNPPHVVLTPVKDPPKPVPAPVRGRPQGGVTVNWRPGSQRPADVVGVGDSPIDHFFGAIGSAIGSDFTPGKLSRPAVVDHR